MLTAWRSSSLFWCEQVVSNGGGWASAAGWRVSCMSVSEPHTDTGWGSPHPWVGVGWGKRCLVNACGRFAESVLKYLTKTLGAVIPRSFVTYLLSLRDALQPASTPQIDQRWTFVNFYSSVTSSPNKPSPSIFRLFLPPRQPRCWATVRHSVFTQSFSTPTLICTAGRIAFLQLSLLLTVSRCVAIPFLQVIAQGILIKAKICCQEVTFQTSGDFNVT